LYSTDQNEQSGSSNYINVVNNDDSDNNDDGDNNYDSDSNDVDRENLGAEDLIVLDISLALPTITKAHRRIHAQIREQPRHNGSHELTLENIVCHRQACNNLVMPVTPRSK